MQTTKIQPPRKNRVKCM